MDEKIIGNYKIIRKIGSGGMAKVFLAVHKDIPNLQVVLKILSDPRLEERFKQEADKLALLDGHRNICRIKHFFNHGDDFVIAMDYIDGQTLDEIIKQKGSLSESEALGIIDEVLDILQTAHDKKIYHRDIKPSNVMIDRQGGVKVIDFGIAKAESDPNLTVAGSSTGTPAYMAPEQFGSPESINYARCDIYAVGTTLFKMLTGQLPYSGDNEFALRDAKLFNEPVRPGSIKSDINKQLEKIILDTLHAEPEKRIGTIRKLRELLSGLNIKRAAKSRKEKVVPEETVSITKAKPKSKTIPMVAGVIVTALILFFGYKYFAGDESQVIEPEPSVAEESIADIEEPTDDQESSKRSVLTAPGLGKIDVEIEPFGDLYVDDKLVRSGAHKMIVTREEGNHQIRIENDRALGQQIFIDTVAVIANQLVERSFKFDVPAPRPAGEIPAITEMPPGKILVGSRPRGAVIYIDGVLQEEKTPYSFVAEVGQHIVFMELTHEGQTYKHTDTVTVQPNSLVKVLYTL